MEPIAFESVLKVPEMGLDLRKSHFDRVEVGALGRLKQESGTDILQDLGGSGAVVDGEVVEDDDIAAVEGRCELRIDVSVEGGAVHGVVNP